MQKVDQPHEELRADDATAPIIGAEHTFGSVTDKISALWLEREHRPLYTALLRV